MLLNSGARNIALALTFTVTPHVWCNHRLAHEHEGLVCFRLCFFFFILYLLIQDQLYTKKHTKATKEIDGMKFGRFNRVQQSIFKRTVAVCESICHNEICIVEGRLGGSLPL